MARKPRLYVMVTAEEVAIPTGECGFSQSNRKSLRNSGTGARFSGRLATAPAEEGPMQLQISTRTLDGVLIVDCHGRIVFGEESALLRDRVRQLIAEHRNLVLNLGGINYIDSGGLGTLVSLYTTAHNAGGSIKLANLTQRVGDLLQVTKLVTIFEVFPNVEEAVESYKKTAAA